MSLLRKLFGGFKNDPANEKLIALLNGIVMPLQESAVQQIDNAAQFIHDSNSQGRFMLLLMHTCLASVLHCLENGPNNHLSTSFKDFAISQWHRSPNVTIDSNHKLFTYSQKQLGESLVNPNEDQLEDVGLVLLSMAIPDQEEFAIGAALACGQAAYACWQQASMITMSVTGTWPNDTDKEGNQ